MAYRFEGKQKLWSFGAYPAVSLKDARPRRDDAREAVLAKEREERDTFEFVARKWFAKYEPTLSEKHAKKLRCYLENTLFPAIGGKPIIQPEPADFLQVVRPSERIGHHETAHYCGSISDGSLCLSRDASPKIPSGANLLLPKDYAHAPDRYRVALPEIERDTVKACRLRRLVSVCFRIRRQTLAHGLPFDR